MLRFPLARAVSSTEALIEALPLPTVRVELPPEEEILQLVPEIPVSPEEVTVRVGGKYHKEATAPEIVLYETGVPSGARVPLVLATLKKENALLEVL
jgi:hypothetical protein